MSEHTPLPNGGTRVRLAWWDRGGYPGGPLRLWPEEMEFFNERYGLPKGTEWTRVGDGSWVSDSPIPSPHEPDPFLDQQVWTAIEPKTGRAWCTPGIYTLEHARSVASMHVHSYNTVARWNEETLSWIPAPPAPEEVTGTPVGWALRIGEVWHGCYPAREIAYERARWLHPPNGTLISVLPIVEEES